MYAFGFPDYMLPELPQGLACEHCGRSGQTLILSPPEVRQKGIFIVFHYVCRCTCGRGTPLRVELPILLYGFILARLAIIDAYRRRRRQPTRTVSPGRCEHFRQLTREFEAEFDAFAKAVASEDRNAKPPDEENRPTPSPSLAPTELDRWRFHLRAEEWQKFLRRMGFDAEDRPPA